MSKYMHLKVLKKSTQLNLSVDEPILHDKAENILWSQKCGIINNNKKIPVNMTIFLSTSV
jgi:hypothetical protein